MPNGNILEFSIRVGNLHDEDYAMAHLMSVSCSVLRAVLRFCHGKPSASPWTPEVLACIIETDTTVEVTIPNLSLANVSGLVAVVEAELPCDKVSWVERETSVHFIYHIV